MTERAKYWATQVAAWERSGLTQAEYCRRRRIKPGSFAWWKRQLLVPARPADRAKQSARASKQRVRLTKPGERAKRPTASANLSTPFVELPMKGATPSMGTLAVMGAVPRECVLSTPMYEVILVSGRSIRVPAQFDPETLTRLILVVESC